MKHFIRTTLALFALAMIFIVQAEDKRINVEAKLASSYISSNGGIAYLHITLHAPRVGKAERKPMNLAVVLDRSGSMGSEHKMENAKAALRSLIDQLSDEDVFSLVIYDDVVDVLRESGRVQNKRELKRLVDEISPRGSTNLGGGMVEGLRQAEHAFRAGFVNRVVLLSDGLANAGIVDPHELGRIAREYRNRSISLTAMGVGVEYNENLMTSLAENGGGNYYFIESPRTLASMMQKEFQSLTTLCANNVVIELRLDKNIKMRDVIGYEWKQEQDLCRISAGDVYGGEEREFTVELDIPKGTGSLSLLNGSLAYEPVGDVERNPATFASSVNYTQDVKVIEKHRDLNVQSRVDVAVSTRAVDQATKAMDAGDYKKAEEVMNDAEVSLKASPAASGAGAASTSVQNQIGELGTFKRMLKDSAGDYNRAKKAIQYQNYQTQKNKK